MHEPVYLCCANESVLADVSSVVPSVSDSRESPTQRGRRPLWAGGQGSLPAQWGPAVFAVRQGKLFYIAHSRCPSHNRRLGLRGEVHLTGVLS